MRLVHIIISLILLLLGPITSSSIVSRMVCSGAVQSGQIEKQVKVAPGQKLVLDLKTGGGVKITGWDQDTVSVKAYPGGRDSQDCTVDIEATSDGAKVTSNYKGGRQSYSTSYNFDIQVPQQFNVEIRSAGGSLTISNVQGQMSGATGGGSITITDAKGEAQLSTGGGSITVKDSFLDGTVRTGGGHVVIQNVTGDLNGSSGGGNVELRNVTRSTGKSTGDKVIIKNAGGQIDVDNAPNGADVKTGGGKIHIRSASGAVKASTGGGNIDIDSVDGPVKASTGAGRVQVTVTGNGGDINITSGTGDITVTLPAAFSGAFDLKLGYTREDKNYQIVSDFEMSRQSTSEWSSGEGTPRKYIYGTGSVAGGKNTIHISTTNGNIYIKRGQ